MDWLKHKDTQDKAALYFHKSFCLRFHEILFDRMQTLLCISLHTIFQAQTSTWQEREDDRIPLNISKPDKLG